MNNGMKEGGEGNRIVSPAVPGIILVLSAALSALGLAKGSALIGLLFMMASAAMLALLICMRAAVVCCVACPISVAAGSVIITIAGGGVDSVIAFCAFVAVGGMLALCVTKKSDRTGTVVAMSAALALMILIAFAAEYFSGCRAFSAEGIKAFVEEKIAVIRTLIGDMVNAYADALKSMGQTIEDTYVKELKDGLANTFIVLLPGFIIAILQVFCYFVTCIFKFSARKAHCEVILPSPRWELYPTMVTVIIYAVASLVLGISYLIAMFSSSGSVVQIVAYNLVLITSPVFAAIGVGVTMGKRSPAAPGRKGMSIFIFALFLIFATQIAYTMISIIGAIAVFVRRKAESAPKNDDENGMM